MSFTTASNSTSAVTLTVTSSDLGNTGSGGAQTDVDTVTLNVTAVNDAPTLGNGTLAAVNEDTPSPAGQSVSTIFSGQFADVDAGSSFDGIAVVGNTANAGRRASGSTRPTAGPTGSRSARWLTTPRRGRSAALR